MTTYHYALMARVWSMVFGIYSCDTIHLNMEKTATGRNFIITPTEAQIFHVSGYKEDDGEWWYRDRFAYQEDVQVQGGAFVSSIEKYLNAADRVGALDNAKMLLVKPMAALVLYSLDIIPVERFQEVTERSSGYFDIPSSELSDTMPIRVAQHPGTTLIVVDERGYPVYTD